MDRLTAHRWRKGVTSMLALGMAMWLYACSDSPVDSQVAEVAYIAMAQGGADKGPTGAVDSLHPGDVSIDVGETVQLSAYDKRGNELAASWSVQDAAIATVSSSGLVTGAGEGATTVSAHTKGKPATATVSVTETGTADEPTDEPADEPADAPAQEPTNEAPTADAGGPYSGTAGSAVSFDGSGSSDPDGDTPLTYAWNFGDGGTASGAKPSYTYSSAGTYNVTLRVTDSQGLQSSSVSATATISAPAVSEPAPTPSGDLLFVGDAETGNASQWCGVHSAVSVPPVVTSPVRDGRYAFKSEVRDGHEIYGTERSEYANGPSLCGNHTYREGDVNFTAVSVYPAADFPVYSHWSLVTQFKGPHTGTPPMQISLMNDKWYIVGEGRTASPRPRWEIAGIRRGQWNDFVVHAKWSPDPNVGWFEVYFQGELVIPRTYAQTMYLDDGVATPLFLSVGQYRDTSPTSGTGVMYIDAVKVGTSLADVTPPKQ